MNTAIACRLHFRHALPLLIAALALPAAPAGAQPAASQSATIAATNIPNISVTPRRVVFTARKRSEAVFVFNQGATPITVDIALIDNVMLPTGEIMPVAEALKRGGAAALLASKVASARADMIVAPSRMQLAAGKGRTVRIQAPVGADGAAVEARSHLTITTVPPASSGLTAEQAAEAARRGELSFNVQTIFGISIPVIVRSGLPTAQVSFGALTLARDVAQPPARGTIPVLVVPINRGGTKSVYGNLEVRVGKGKSSEVIGLARGLGVYPELDQRIVRLALSRQPRTGEVLNVTYYDDEPTATNGKLATGELIAK